MRRMKLVLYRLAAAGKRAADEFEARAPVQQYTDRIEAHAFPGHTGAQRVIARRAYESVAFFGVDRAVRRAELLRGAGLHFDEGERASLPRDQVDFAGARTRAPVARHHAIAVAPEEPVREVFAESARCLVRRPAPPARPLPQPV